VLKIISKKVLNYDSEDKKMKLSISRDNNDLTPEQPSVDENIAEANEILKDYGKELDKEYINDNGYWEFLIWKYKELGRPDNMKELFLNEAIKWGLFLFEKGGGKMDLKNLGFEAANFIMDETELDDQLYKYLANQAKKEIPGHNIEPIAGKMLEGIGKELQKPLETD